MATLSPEQRKQQIWSVIRVSSGNFLEMYDFFVFGYYASAIGKVFFPTGSDFAQLMLAFMTFGAGFLMRAFAPFLFWTFDDCFLRLAIVDPLVGAPLDARSQKTTSPESRQPTLRVINR